MITEATIQDALSDLRSEPEALEEIAAEYGIKPEVLRARAEKAFGSVEAIAERAAKAVELAERHERERQAKVAAGIARLESQFIITRDHPLRGTEFNYKGDRYMFVLVSASHPTYYARCVRLSDGATLGFNKPAYDKLIAVAARIAEKASA